jgi:hypothetical protein
VNALRAMLRTFGVLLGIWVVLAVVGLAFGVIPGVPGYRGGGTTDGGDGGDVAPEALADGGLDPGPDGGVAEEAVADAGLALPRLRRDRWIVCPEPAMAPSLAAVDFTGDGRAELVVGCGARWEVVAVIGGTPSRIARIEAPAVDDETSPATGAAVAVAFDANPSLDLLLPFARYGAGGSTRGGALYVLARDEFGGFDGARALAPIAAVAIASGAIDGDSTTDVAVLHRANPFARLPSEAWVFLGGASPARRAVLRSGTASEALAMIDMNRDGKLDILIGSSEESRLDVFFGAGNGTFPRHHTLAIPNVVSIAAGDVDGDGAADAIVEAGGVVIVLARPEGTALEAARIEAVPATARGVEAADLDGNGDVEIVAWDHPRLVVIDVAADRAEMRALVELGPGEFGPRRQRLIELDGSGAPELVLLGTSAIDGERALELVIVPGAERGIVDVGERRPVEDAPLMLRVPLPDTQTP